MTYGLMAASVGLLGGVGLGLAMRLGHFCTLGAIESALYGDNQTRMRMWGIVLATAIFGVYFLHSIGEINFKTTLYHRNAFNPLAHIIGGLIFGYGMAMAGNCGFTALARFGGGDLRSLVVLVVIAVFGFVTLNGPLSNLRVALFDVEPALGNQSLALLISRLSGVPPLGIATAISIVLATWALSYEKLRQSPPHLFWAVIAGLSIVSGFWGMTWVHEVSFGQLPVEGHTFTAPLGRTLLFLMTSSAGGIDFAVGSVSGVVAGAYLGSLLKGNFKWEACEDPRELGRQVGGAALMGIGGVIAMGCSIGQGVSAMATLSYSAPVTLAAVVVGGIVGVKHLVQGFEDI
ncbi:MAG: YeeE/YedE family protein [Halocynthiibacter sp.]